MTDFGNIRGKWLKVMLFMSIDAEGTTFIEKKEGFCNDSQTLANLAGF